MVVVHHALTYPDAPHPLARYVDWLSPGHLGVVLFFVISGFCIHARWARDADAPTSPTMAWLAFWKRRVRRLYPPYLAALALSIAMVATAVAAGAVTPLTEIYDGHLTGVARDFALHVAMLHGFHPVYDRAGGNPPFWTLAREEHFYVLYALLLASRRRWGVGVPIGIAFAVGIVVWRIALLIPDPSWQVLVETSAPALWIQWALGMLAVEAYWGRVRLPWWCASWPVALAWAAIAKASETWGLQLPPAALWGMVCFTVINAATRADAAGRWRGALAMRLSALGRMSYSLYLVHYPVRAVLKYGLRLDPAPDTFTYLANAALMVIAGCVAAAVFFVVIERRFLTHGAGAATGWTA